MNPAADKDPYETLMVLHGSLVVAATLILMMAYCIAGTQPPVQRIGVVNLFLGISFALAWFRKVPVK